MNCISSLTLYLVPSADWEEKADPGEDISLFVEDALAIERRLKKGVNLINERKRYLLCCRRIQEHVLKKRNSYKSETVGEGYFSFLQETYEEYPGEVVQHRIASCFFPPETMAAQVESLRMLHAKNANDTYTDVRNKVSFLEKALAENAGVIEIPNYIISGKKSAVIKRYEESNTSTTLAPFKDDGLSDEQIKDMSDVLRLRIEKALATGCEVNFSNQPHFVITEVLNDYVYQDEEGGNGVSVRVVYADGSEAEPFPLRCLPKAQALDNIDTLYSPLRAALVSMRHLEMDERVDFAWFRNRKVSASLSCSDTDTYCTAETIAALKNHPGVLNLHLYQTGLETAVIGFYRGLVKTLLKRKQVHDTTFLRIVPYYYDHKYGTYKPGKPWA